MDVVEASIADLRTALDSGKVTSVALVAAYLRRIAYYDRHGLRLNAVTDLSRTAFADARASDRRRARGAPLSPLDGIPYTAKDSYAIQGMHVSAGSPAFADVVAGADAFVIERLRAAGAIVLGHTNMPPLACGGMQRGLDGRAESPYNGAFLTAAWTSGSSNGSGTATGASFAAFGLGEETWSSGRAPANNNALCAYTPSWGVISLRGNWPLVPTMDVVVPHTRSMGDMLALLDVIVADDTNTRGDFWRVQRAVAIPPASELRPASYAALQKPSEKPLAGMRIGMPRRYLGKEDIHIRPSVLALAEAAAASMRALGAEVVETDLPVVDAYESKRHPFPRSVQGGLEDAGFLPKGYDDAEYVGLCTFAFEDYLRANAEAGGSGPATLADADPDLFFPLPTGQIRDHIGTPAFGMGEYVRLLAEHGFRAPADVPLAAEGLRGLDRARRELLEDWMDAQGLTALAWPASCDAAPADADTDPASHTIAVRNGTWVANGNLVPRHLGIPTVTVPMGLAADIGMPFGLTLAGRGWDDTRLLQIAADLEGALPPRPVPPRTPALAPLVPAAGGEGAGAADGEFVLQVEREYVADSRVHYTVRGRAPGAIRSATVTINGEPADIEIAGSEMTARGSVPAEELQRLHSQWRVPYGTVVVATVSGAFGELGAFEIVGGR
jgi:amidase